MLNRGLNWESASMGNRRKQIIVDRDFQLRFACRLGGAAGFALLCYLGVAAAVPWLLNFLGGSADSPAVTREAVTYLVIPGAVTVLFLFLHGVRESFRIAGPAVNLRSVARGLSGLRIPARVQVRKDDYLRDLANDLDGGLRRLHDTIAEAQEQCTRATDAATSHRANPAVLAKLSELQHTLDRFLLEGKAAAPNNESLEEPPCDVPDAIGAHAND